MNIDLSKKDTIILISALDLYISDLERRERYADRLFESYSIEKRKQLSEENKVLLSVRMRAVHRLRESLLDSAFDFTYLADVD